MDLTDWSESAHPGAVTALQPEPVGHSRHAGGHHTATFHATSNTIDRRVKDALGARCPECAPTLLEHVYGWLLVPLAAVVVGWAWARTWVRA